MKRKIQLLGIFALIMLVFIVGLRGTFDGYYGFYYPKNDYKKPVAFSISESIITWKPVSVFLSYTGFDTGYGFFAPNVASDFVLLFELKDIEGKTIDTRFLPYFKNKESFIRYSSVFNMFLDKLSDEKENKENKYQKYLDIIIKQIAINVKKQNPKATSIIAKLYLYDYPTLQNYKKGNTQEKLILIGTYK